MRYCKYCGGKAADDAIFCPVCGKHIAAPSKQTSTGLNSLWDKLSSSKHRKLITVIACLAVCLVVFSLVSGSFPGRCAAGGCHNKTVSGSKYCYAHKCAISSCDSPRYRYSNYCYSHYLLYDDDASSEKISSSDLKISGVRCSNNSVYTVADGIITNNGDVTVRFVEIKGSFKDSSGNVVDTDSTYAVGSEGLAPGESCKWHMSVDKDYRIDSCSVSILDFDT